jgi:hypothetical protein
MDVATEPVAADNTGAAQSTTPEPDDTSSDNPIGTLMGRLRAKFGDNPTGEAEGDPPPATPETTPETTPAPEAKPEPDKPPAEPEPPKPDRLELQHARALTDLTKVKSEALTHKSRADTAEAKLADLLERGKRDPIALAAELHGKDWKELLSSYAKGEFDQRAPQRSPEEQELHDYVRKMKARDAEREKQEKRQADFAVDLPKVKQLLEVSGADFPIFTSFPDAAEELLNELYDEADKSGGQMPDIRARLAALEETGKKSFADYFANKKLVAHIATTNPAARAAMTEALGLPEQKTAGPASSPQGTSTTPRSGDPPRTVATQNEVPTRTDREPTDEELRAESIALLRKGREAGLFGGR